MGVDYTSGAFFGTFAKSGSVAEQRLQGLRDDESGEFVFDQVPGVSVGQHGNAWSGKYEYAIKQTGGAAFASRSGGHSQPFKLSDAKPELIIEAMGRLGLSQDDFEPIGFYLYLDVW
jgi:hypothetical protein